MIIEQSMLKSMKTDGCSSRGTSTKESGKQKWCTVCLQWSSPTFCSAGIFVNSILYNGQISNKNGEMRINIVLAKRVLMIKGSQKSNSTNISRPLFINIHIQNSYKIMVHIYNQCVIGGIAGVILFTITICNSETMLNLDLLK